MNVTGIRSAENLETQDAEMLDELIHVYDKNIDKNKLLREYYEDKVPVKDIGMDVPKRLMKSINTATGWAAKGIDLLAARSQFDGFFFNEASPEGFDFELSANRFAAKYDRILVSELINGCSFWTVGKSGLGVKINAYNALSAAATWDYKHERIKAGFVIADKRKFSKYGEVVPSLIVMHTKKYIINLIRDENKKWHASYEENPMGRPMMEAMCNGERDDKRFGKSRITPMVMATIDSMQRELVYTELQSATSSIPQKWINNLTDEQFDAIKEDKERFYMDKLMLFTDNENNGGSAQLNLLQAASPEPHISMQKHLANKIAAEFSMPVATFGVPGNGYTSSDALRASNDDLVSVAKALNKNNQEALVNVGLMVLAVMRNCSIYELEQNDYTISVHWKDEEMLSASQSADANIKIASVMQGYADTDTFKERVGFAENERKRLDTELNGAAGRAAAMARLFPNEGE